MSGPRLSENPARHSCSGHHRCALRHGVADLEHLGDVRIVNFAEVIPNRGLRRHDVRLVATISNDVVRALLRTQVLTTEIPADVHQLDRIKRAPAAPRGCCRVRRFSTKRVLH